jgi:hypothetical protein
VGNEKQVLGTWGWGLAMKTCPPSDCVGITRSICPAAQESLEREIFF